MGSKIWRKRVLVPLWVAQIVFSLILVGLSALALWAVNVYQDNETSDGDQNIGTAIHDINIGAAISMALGIFTVLLDIVEIIMVGTHRLQPVAHIVMQCIKSFIWTVYFGLEIAATVAGTSSGVGMFLVLVLFLSSIGQLIYGAVMVHRLRKGTLFGRDYENGYTSAPAYPINNDQAANTAYNPSYEMENKPLRY